MSHTENMRKIMESMNTSHLTESPSDADELQQIQEEMLELLNQAEHVVRTAGDRTIQARAEAYWIPHMRAQLEGGPGTMYSVAETIDELRDLAYDGDEEEDDGSLDYAARQNDIR